jgi:hypothetical protein
MHTSLPARVAAGGTEASTFSKGGCSDYATEERRRVSGAIEATHARQSK